MIVILVILFLALWATLYIRDRRRGRIPKIRRRDLRALRRDLESWQRGARPLLRETEDED